MPAANRLRRTLQEEDMGWAEEFVRTVERSGAERPARSSGKAAGDTVRRRNRAIRGYIVSLKKVLSTSRSVGELRV